MLQLLLSLFKRSDKRSDKRSYVCTDIRRIEYGDPRYSASTKELMWVATISELDDDKKISDFQIFNSRDTPVIWNVSWRFENGLTCYESMTSKRFHLLQDAIIDKFDKNAAENIQTNAALMIAEVKRVMKKD